MSVWTPKNGRLERRSLSLGLLIESSPLFSKLPKKVYVSITGLLLFSLYVLAGLAHENLKTSTAPPPQRPICNNTAQGPHLVTDDRGVVCRRPHLDPNTGCCKLQNSPVDQYSCSTCNTTSHCCAVYEYCVSCCLSPASLSTRMTQILDNSLNQILRRSKDSPFEFCRNLCRTSSDSVVGENRYRSEFKFCYGAEVPPSPLIAAEQEEKLHKQKQQSQPRPSPSKPLQALIELVDGSKPAQQMAHSASRARQSPAKARRDYPHVHLISGDQRPHAFGARNADAHYPVDDQWFASRLYYSIFTSTSRRIEVSLLALITCLFPLVLLFL